MKVGIILVLVVMSIITPSLSYGAETDLQFGTRFIPSMLVQDREGMIQVFAKQGTSIVPEKIQGLTVTSLDSSILRVLTVKNSESGFVSEVTIKGIKAGESKLFFAAPGFKSLELPVKVYGNVHNQEKLLVKVVPDTFSSDGPFRGLVSVELADIDGFPVRASEDLNIQLNVANNKILEIFQKDLVIKKGEYFTGSHFTVKESGIIGKTNIYATAKGMESKSKDIKIDEPNDDLEVKLYILQDKLNTSTNAAIGDIIVILQKESGDEPVIANKDIIVKYKVTNDIFGNQNTSPNAALGESVGTITIKKGSYWGHNTFTLLGGQQGKYLVTMTSGDPISLDTKTVEATFYDQKVPNSPSNDGDRFVKFDGLPIFATGNKELIGMVHLEDKDGFPIVANKNLEITIDSSDDEFLSIDPVFLPVGSGTALVFGQVGHSLPGGVSSNEFQINPVVEVEDESAKTTEVEIFGPEEKSHKLVAEPLIDKILAYTEFPIVVYLTDGKEVTKFPKNSNLFSSPSKIFDVESKSVMRGDDLIMLNVFASDQGKETLQFTVQDVKDAEVTIESLLLKPANIIIDHSETIFTGTNDVFAIQLVNSQGLPVFATDDIEINFVVNDASLIQVPATATIKRGEYYTLFDVGPKAGGTTEISALSEGFPISTTNVQLKSLAPTIFLDTPEIIENGEVFTVKVAAKQDNNPLANMKVKWEVTGGVLQLSDKKTSSTGEAIASIISTSDKQVNVQASVSGTYYSPTEISKTVRVNATSEFLAFAEEEFTKPEIGGVDPVIILVPTMIILMGYMLMKKGVIKIKNTPSTPKPVQIQEV
ncbi:MAG: Ig-like domain-containing protein [Nitrosopumilaceae archaeon]